MPDRRAFLEQLGTSAMFAALPLSLGGIAEFVPTSTLFHRGDTSLAGNAGENCATSEQPEGRHRVLPSTQTEKSGEKYYGSARRPGENVAAPLTK